MSITKKLTKKLTDIKYAITETISIVKADVEHDEIHEMLAISSGYELLIAIDSNFEKEFRNMRARRTLMLGIGWLIFQFVKYKVYQYKKKYPEYLL